MKTTSRLLAPAALIALCTCIPDDTSKPNWGIGQGVVGSNDTGSAPGVLVIGDSLMNGVGPQTMANAIRFFEGTDSVVVASSGAGVAHFNKPSLIQSANLSTIQNYQDFFGSIRVTVVALGSNDARIITAERGVDQLAYTIDEYFQQEELAVSASLSHSNCVILVNVANHWFAAAPDVVDSINGFIQGLDEQGGRVRKADWNAFSAPHPEWFLNPGEIHHTPAGSEAYRDFINGKIGEALASGC